MIKVMPVDNEKFSPREEEDSLPKINQFAKELANWLSLVSILLFLIYGVLTLVFEIALDLAQVRWAFIAYLAFCVVDVVAYWICRFAVEDSTGEEKCLLHLVFASQIVAGLFYLIAPVVVLSTYRFTPEITAKNDNRLVKDESARDEDKDSFEEDQYKHTFEDYVQLDPCFNDETGNPMWQCSYVKSIKIAAWCMLINVIPKVFMIYVVWRILKPFKK